MAKCFQSREEAQDATVWHKGMVDQRYCVIDTKFRGVLQSFLPADLVTVTSNDLEDLIDLTSAGFIGSWVIQLVNLGLSFTLEICFCFECDERILLQDDLKNGYNVSH